MHLALPDNGNWSHIAMHDSAVGLEVQQIVVSLIIVIVVKMDAVEDV